MVNLVTSSYRAVNPDVRGVGFSRVYSLNSSPDFGAQASEFMKIGVFMKVELVDFKAATRAAALAFSFVGGSSASATTIDFTTSTPGVIIGLIGSFTFADFSGLGGA